MQSFEKAFIELNRKLKEALTNNPEALSLWDKLEAASREEFIRKCGWRNARQEPIVQNFPEDFHLSVHRVMQLRSECLAANEMLRRLAEGVEPTETMDVYAIIIEERDNNTPEYQRRRLLYNTARQLAGEPAV